MKNKTNNITSTSQTIPIGIWILGFVSMLMDISSEMIHSLLPLFMVNVLGASVIWVGLVEGLAESIALLVRVFSGVLSDYIGKRKGLTVMGYALGTVSKPLFAITSNMGGVVFARLLDRFGKGIRSAPRDALIADIAPPKLRGAAFGLRQSLDTVGGFIGPLLAAGLLLLWHNDFRTIFWIATIPAVLSVVLLIFGIREPQNQTQTHRINPISRNNLQRLPKTYWYVIMIGAIFTLARFSEAFLVLRAQQIGIATNLIPLVMVALNVVYSVFAYPFGKLSDRMNHVTLLSWGLLVLLIADVTLANATHWSFVLLGVALWGAHMGMTQGLLATMVANTTHNDLRGTAYGFFNLVSGVVMLAASLMAGWLWEEQGANWTFYAGALVCVITLVILRSLPFQSINSTKN